MLTLQTLKHFALTDQKLVIGFWLNFRLAMLITATDVNGCRRFLKSSRICVFQVCFKTGILNVNTDAEHSTKCFLLCA